MDREPEFSAYVSARRAQLYRTACLLCGDPHRAEDVVQDALAKLYANWPRVSRAGSVEGTLIAAMRSVIADVRAGRVSAQPR